MTVRHDVADAVRIPAGDAMKPYGRGIVLAMVAGLLLQVVGVVSGGLYASPVASALGGPTSRWFSGIPAS